jgi:hypothetical protein
MPLPENIDGLSPAELKLLVVRLLEEVADLRRTIAALRDENARLKGGPPRPNIKAKRKPSGMEHRLLATNGTLAGAVDPSAASCRAEHRTACEYTRFAGPTPNDLPLPSSVQRCQSGSVSTVRCYKSQRPARAARIWA